MTKCDQARYIYIIYNVTPLVWGSAMMTSDLFPSKYGDFGTIFPNKILSPLCVRTGFSFYLHGVKFCPKNKTLKFTLKFVKIF
jgi:hypothetical protein